MPQAAHIDKANVDNAMVQQSPESAMAQQAGNVLNALFSGVFDAYTKTMDDLHQSGHHHAQQVNAFSAQSCSAQERIAHHQIFAESETQRAQSRERLYRHNTQAILFLATVLIVAGMTAFITNERRQ